MKLKINELKSNESNPRLIKNHKFKKLVQSIKDFPEMLELRPVIVDEDMTILGGNMRYRACKEAGLKAYHGILKEFIREDEDGGISITQVCRVAGLGGNPYRDGSYEYYVNEIIRDNDPKGVGPFILASLIYESLD